MKDLWICLCFLLGSSVPLGAQSILNFPRLFSDAEIATTGIAIVNPTTASAPVILNMYAADGARLASSTITVPAGSQKAFLISEFSGITGRPGWVSAASDVSGLAAFWVGGDFATFTDGASLVSLK